jgi:hypothetical protein
MRRKEGLMPEPLNCLSASPLSSILTDHNISVRRTLQKVEGNKVVLLHIEQLPPHPPITSPVLQLAFGDPSEYEGAGFILEDGSEWSRVGQEPTSSFNCHAYSLGERVGLTPTDWVEGEPTDLSLDTNPAEILLTTYFKRRRALRVNQYDSLIHDLALREGDVLSFTYKVPFWGIVHLHSGRIQKVNRQNWMASKLRTGRLLVTPIPDVLWLYPETQTIHAYRLRGE